MVCGFCASDADAGVEVAPDGLCATGQADRRHKWLGVRGRSGMLCGAYQFEVRLQEACLVRVGWAAQASNRVLGLDSMSFGYGGTGMLSTNRKFEKYGEEYYQTPGAVVTCLLDRRDPQMETISFCLNGQSLGIAFQLPVELAGVPLFPAVCGKDSWSAELWPQGLAFPQDGYRPLAEALAAGDAVAGPLVIGLCAQDADPFVDVAEDGCHAMCQPEKNSWFGVRGRPGVLRGRYQFEVETGSDCLLRVGWSGGKSNRAIGNDAQSFGYGGTAKKSNGGQYSDYGERYQGRIGVVISCLIDRRDPDQQTISYSLNGRNLGVAFHVPSQLQDLPLFPAMCGKGEWSAICRCADLKFPEDGYRPLSEALAARDAVACERLTHCMAPPKGVPVVHSSGLADGLVQSSRTRDPHAQLEAMAQQAVRVEGVRPGRRVVLHVLSGPWQGWYTCQVVSTDPMGCYLRHESDGFTENVPWGFLNGGKYHMELLPDKTTTEALARETISGSDNRQETPDDGRMSREVADLLRIGYLRVHSDLGAGLTLMATEYGYFVSGVEAPGQADLRKGDVIIAIGKTLLMGLEESEVDACFGAAFKDACQFVTGSYLSLRRCPFAEVRVQAQQLLERSKPALRVAGEIHTPTLSLLRSLSYGSTFSGSLLRKCRLRLDIVSGHAGLELTTCEAGYLIDSVLAWPGQPDLSAGDAILAIGSQVLMGLQAERVEELFGDTICDGAELITGSLIELMQWPWKVVQNEVNRFLAKEALSRPELERSVTH